MDVVKRGARTCRRAQVTHEILYLIFEVLIFAFFAFLLISFVRDVQTNAIFEKNYLARDLAMTVNVLYASPGEVSYAYPENTTLYIVKFSENGVKVRKPDQPTQQEVAKFYWYADEKKSVLDENSEFSRADTLGFAKSVGSDGYTLSLFKTRIIYPFDKGPESLAAVAQPAVSHPTATPGAPQPAKGGVAGADQSVGESAIVQPVPQQ